jgi:hypothetical protein
VVVPFQVDLFRVCLKLVNGAWHIFGGGFANCEQIDEKGLRISSVVAGECGDAWLLRGELG